MTSPFLALICAALVGACGCSQATLIENLAPADLQQASRKAYSDLAARRFDPITARLSDKLKGRDLDEDFRKMAQVIPHEQPSGVTAVGFHATSGTGGGRFDLSYRYQYSSQWILAQFMWRRVNGELKLVSFHVRALDNSTTLADLDTDAFTLRGKDAAHYGVLLLAAAALAVSLVGLIACLRTQGLRHKWAWLLFIAVGFFGFTFNWSTGQTQFLFLNFQLLSVGGFRFDGGPWVFTVSLPVGALAFLEKLRRHKRDKGQAPPML